MSSRGYAAAFAAQKTARGAYSRETKNLVAYTQELSEENYSALTVERLKREKELRAETARRRKAQRQRAKAQKRALEMEREQTLKERTEKKKNDGKCKNALTKREERVTVRHKKQEGARVFKPCR